MTVSRRRDLVETAVSAPLPALAAAVPQSTLPPGTSVVGWVTGPDSPNKTAANFAVTGTDLGIMWDNGDPANSQVPMATDGPGRCRIQHRACQTPFV